MLPHGAQLPERARAAETAIGSTTTGEHVCIYSSPIQLPKLLRLLRESTLIQRQQIVHQQQHLHSKPLHVHDAGCAPNSARPELPMGIVLATAASRYQVVRVAVRLYTCLQATRVRIRCSDGNPQATWGAAGDGKEGYPRRRTSPNLSQTPRTGHACSASVPAPRFELLGTEGKTLQLDPAVEE